MDRKISQLPNGGNLTIDDLIPIARLGQNYSLNLFNPTFNRVFGQASAGDPTKSIFSSNIDTLTGFDIPGVGVARIVATGVNVLEVISTKVTINPTTASSSTITGSLVNKGGFGNAGNAYIGGNINNAALTPSKLVFTDPNKNLISSDLSGDVSTSGLTTTLATVNSNIGSFGDGTHVAAFTVNAKGLITAVSSVAITGAAPTGAAGGDLSGTYPNPTVTKINGKSITLGGNLTTSGAFASTFTMTNTTNVTFPPSGTLATTAGTAASITGTANQVLANGFFGIAQTGAITLTLPQSIATTSTVQFGTVNINTATSTGLFNIAGLFGTPGSVGFAAYFNSTLNIASGSLFAQTGINTSFIVSGTADNVYGLYIYQGAASGTVTNAINLFSAIPLYASNNFSAAFAGRITIGSGVVADTRAPVDGILVQGNIINDALTVGSILFAGAGKVISQENANLFYDTFNPNHRFIIGGNSTLSGERLAITGTINVTNAINPLASAYYLDTIINCTGSMTTTLSHWINPRITIASGQTVTSHAGLYVSAGTYSGSGTVTNAFGLSIQLPAGGTKKWAASIDGRMTIGAPVAGDNRAPADGVLISGNIINDALNASSLIATDTNKQFTNTTSGISPTFAGLTISNTGNVQPEIKSTTTGSANAADLFLTRGDSTNGFNRILYRTASTLRWGVGSRSGSENWLIRDEVNSVNILTIAAGVSGTTASALFGVAQNATTYYSFANENNTASAASKLDIRVGGASASDPFLAFDITGVGGYAFGLRNSDSDTLYLTYGSAPTLANTALLKITTAGLVTFAGNIGIAGATANGYLQFPSDLVKRKIVLYENVNNDFQYSGFGIQSGILKYQAGNTTTDHVFYAGLTSTTEQELFRIAGSGIATITATTASSSTITGSLVNKGGFGNAGKAFFGDSVNITSATADPFVVTYSGTAGLGTQIAGFGTGTAERIQFFDEIVASAIGGQIKFNSGNVGRIVGVGSLELWPSSTRICLLTVSSMQAGADNAYTLGASGARWSQLWAGTTTINTSDETTKNSIADTRLGLDFINSLRPREFKFNDHDITEGEEGKEKTRTITHKRVHHGLIAQEVKKVLDELNIDSNDFAGYVDPSVNEAGDTSPCGLRYSEFIGPLIAAVQQLSAQVQTLQNSQPTIN